MPISLTSTPCKHLERITYGRVVSFLESYSFFGNACPRMWHVMRYSTSSCYWRPLFVWFGSVQQWRNISWLRQRFWKGTAQRLLLKLLFLKLDAQAITSIEAFLVNRNQFAYSKNLSCPVSYGVMLSTVLGPIFFVMYIDDVPYFWSSWVRFLSDDYAIVSQLAAPDISDGVLTLTLERERMGRSIFLVDSSFSRRAA